MCSLIKIFNTDCHLAFLFSVDIVQRDLKSTLRVLYAIFQQYKSRIQQQSQPPGASRPTSTSSMQ